MTHLQVWKKTSAVCWFSPCKNWCWQRWTGASDFCLHTAGTTNVQTMNKLDGCCSSQCLFCLNIYSVWRKVKYYVVTLWNSENLMFTFYNFCLSFCHNKHHRTNKFQDTCWCWNWPLIKYLSFHISHQATKTLLTVVVVVVIELWEFTIKGHISSRTFRVSKLTWIYYFYAQ